MSSDKAVFEKAKSIRLARLLIIEYGPLLEAILSKLDSISDTWLRRYFVTFKSLLSSINWDINKCKEWQIKFLTETLLLTVRSFFQVPGYNYMHSKTIYRVIDETLVNFFPAFETSKRKLILTRKITKWIYSSKLLIQSKSLKRNCIPILSQTRAIMEESTNSVKKHEDDNSRSLHLNAGPSVSQTVKYKHLLVDPRLKVHKELKSEKEVTLQKHKSLIDNSQSAGSFDNLSERMHSNSSFYSNEFQERRFYPQEKQMVRRSNYSSSVSHTSHVENPVPWQRAGYKTPIPFDRSEEFGNKNSFSVTNSAHNQVVKRCQTPGVPDNYRSDLYDRLDQYFKDSNSMNLVNESTDYSNQMIRRALNNQDGQFPSVQNSEKLIGTYRYNVSYESFGSKYAKSNYRNISENNVFKGEWMSFSNEYCRKSCNESSCSEQINKSDFPFSDRNKIHHEGLSPMYNTQRNEVGHLHNRCNSTDRHVNQYFEHDTDEKKMQLLNSRDPRAKHSVLYKNLTKSTSVSSTHVESVMNDNVLSSSRKQSSSTVLINDPKEKYNSDLSKNNLRKRLCQEISTVHKVGIKKVISVKKKMVHSSEILDVQEQGSVEKELQLLENAVEGKSEFLKSDNDDKLRYEICEGNSLDLKDDVKQEVLSPSPENCETFKPSFSLTAYLKERRRKNKLTTLQSADFWNAEGRFTRSRARNSPVNKNNTVKKKKIEKKTCDHITKPKVIKKEVNRKSSVPDEDNDIKMDENTEDVIDNETLLKILEDGIDEKKSVEHNTILHNVGNNENELENKSASSEYSKEDNLIINNSVPFKDTESNVYEHKMVTSDGKCMKVEKDKNIDQQVIDSIKITNALNLTPVDEHKECESNNIPSTVNVDVKPYVLDLSIKSNNSSEHCFIPEPKSELQNEVSSIKLEFCYTLIGSSHSQKSVESNSECPLDLCMNTEEDPALIVQQNGSCKVEKSPNTSIIDDVAPENECTDPITITNVNIENNIINKFPLEDDTSFDSECYENLLENALKELNTKRINKMNALALTIAGNNDTSGRMKQLLDLENKLNIKVCLAEPVDESEIVDKNNFTEPAFPEYIFSDSELYKDTVITIGCIEAKQITHWRFRYTCSFNECLFRSSVPDYFIRHLELNHENNSFESTCSVCKCIMGNLLDAFRHLQLHCSPPEEQGSLYMTEQSIVRNMYHLLTFEKIDIFNLFEKDLELIKMRNFSGEERRPEDERSMESKDNDYSGTDSKEPVMRLIYLLGFFKCSTHSCDFSTNRLSEYSNHLITHKYERLSEGPSLDDCPYCEKVITDSISEHMLDEHGTCYNQCPQCMYRSYSPINAVVHEIYSHSEYAFDPVVYKCNIITTGSNKITIVNSSTQCIKEYKCFVKYCSFSTLIPTKYVDHLWEHSIKSLSCFACGARYFSIKQLFQHLEVHSLALVHCSYCNVSDSSPRSIVLHLMLDHPSLLPRLIIREDYNSCQHKLCEKLSPHTAPLAIESETLIEVNVESWLESKIAYQTVLMDTDTCTTLDLKTKEEFDSSSGASWEVDFDEEKIIDEDRETIKVQMDNIFDHIPFSQEFIEVEEMPMSEENEMSSVNEEKIQRKSGVAAVQNDTTSECIKNQLPLKNQMKCISAAKNMKYPKLKNFQCSCCLKILYSVQGLIDHFTHKHKNTHIQYYINNLEVLQGFNLKVVIICYWCNMIFRRKNDLILHTYAFHNNVVLKYFKLKVAFQCPYCYYIDFCWYTILDHYYSLHFILYLCEECGFWHSDYSIVSSHCKSIHRNTELVKSVRTNLHFLNNASCINVVYSQNNRGSVSEFVITENIKASQIMSALYSFNYRTKSGDKKRPKKPNVFELRYVTRSKANKLKLIMNDFEDELSDSPVDCTSIPSSSKDKATQVARKSTTLTNKKCSDNIVCKLRSEMLNPKEYCTKLRENSDKILQANPVPQTARKSTFPKVITQFGTVLGKAKKSVPSDKYSDSFFKMPNLPQRVNKKNVIKNEKHVKKNKNYSENEVSNNNKTENSEYCFHHKELPVVLSIDLKRLLENKIKYIYSLNIWVLI